MKTSNSIIPTFKQKLNVYITYLSTILLWWYWIFVSKNKKVYRDIDANCQDSYDYVPFGNYFMKFCYCMNFKHEFLGIYYLRIGKIRYLRRLLFWFYKPDPTCRIETSEENIGAGFMLGHGFSIECVASSIGEDCQIFQQVTVGFGKGGKPTIGNNVWIYAGAKVLGGVKIGNNVTIGANSVVTHDIPDNAVVAGVPARVLRYKNPDEFVI